MQRTYTLLDSSGQPYASSQPGTLGGNRRSGIYGKLDCASAIAALPRGYARYRVFFADERTALAAGFRPCARCLPDRFAAWKAGQLKQEVTAGD
jgi:methylphosphotriester-DNA--protein-cysteine methyltransferase